MPDERKARLKEDFYDLEKRKKQALQQTEDGFSKFLQPLGFLSRWILAPIFPFVFGAELPNAIPRWIALLPPIFSTFMGTAVFVGFVIVIFVMLTIFYYVYIFRRFRQSNIFGIVVFFGAWYLITNFF